MDLTTSTAAAQSLQYEPNGEDGLSSDMLSYCRAHVLSRIADQPVGEHPFYHTFIEDIFPPDFYEIVRNDMLRFKYSEEVDDRYQDNPAFTNKRYSLFGKKDRVSELIYALFSDPDVKHAFLKKFYANPTKQLVDKLQIHNEFEFVYTKAGRFQEIHIDIPPKFMSFVFYVPEHPISEEQEAKNSTILYDKNLNPCYPARFKANSVCIFVPHFYSYHGFSSTIDRDALVMFYVNQDELADWQAIRQDSKDMPPFTGLLDAIERKLRSHPLIEFGGDEERLVAERAACLVNAPRGRVSI